MAKKRKTVGYILVDDCGPLAKCRAEKGFYAMLHAGGSKGYATMFNTLEEAKTALIADREFCRHVLPQLPKRSLRIFRLER